MNYWEIITNSRKSNLIETTISQETKIGALPPGVQMQKEMDAVLEHSIWKTAAFENEKVIGIKKTDSGFIITTTSYQMYFEVTHLPPVNIGPLPFKIKLDPSSIEKRLSPGSSGVSPEQLKKEINAILGDYLDDIPYYSQASIEEIQRTEKGLTIKTRDRTYQIGIEYKNGSMIVYFS